MKVVSASAAAKNSATSQLDLNFRQWGGARAGAGRKRTSRRIPHRKRPPLAARFPGHVTLTVHNHLPNLRGCMDVFRRAFAAGAKREGFRLVHFSVQRHHIHLVVEAKNSAALSRGIQGLCRRIASGLNKCWGGRRGSVFADRYHLRILKTPQEVRGVLSYVLHNARKHYAQQGRAVERRWLDPCSSAHYLDGWLDRPFRPPTDDPPLVVPPKTWLLSIGWRRHGLLSIEGKRTVRQKGLKTFRTED